jgi:hypothetical protein
LQICFVILYICTYLDDCKTMNMSRLRMYQDYQRFWIQYSTTTVNMSRYTLSLGLSTCICTLRHYDYQHVKVPAGTATINMSGCSMAINMSRYQLSLKLITFRVQVTQPSNYPGISTKTSKCPGSSTATINLSMY